MVYNNGFPVTYPQMYYPQVQYPQVSQYSPTAQQPQTQGVIWVQGKASAQSYVIPAGQSAILLDSDGPFAYKKETAPDGRPLPMETYRLVREEETPAPVQAPDLTGYVKETDVEEIVREEVERRISELSFKPTRKKNVTEE